MKNPIQYTLITNFKIIVSFGSLSTSLNLVVFTETVFEKIM